MKKPTFKFFILLVAMTTFTLSCYGAETEMAVGESIEITTEEVREGGLNEYSFKLPTGVKYGNLVLKRGMFNDSDVARWCRKAIENFQFEPTTVKVTLLNEEHNNLASWDFAGVYPLKWSISDFKAQDNAIVVESLELAYRYFRKG